jgi:hypothetical protein
MHHEYLRQKRTITRLAYPAHKGLGVQTQYKSTSARFAKSRLWKRPTGSDTRKHIKNDQKSSSATIAPPNIFWIRTLSITTFRSTLAPIVIAALGVRTKDMCKRQDDIERSVLAGDAVFASISRRIGLRDATTSLTTSIMRARPWRTGAIVLSYIPYCRDRPYSQSGMQSSKV